MYLPHPADRLRRMLAVSLLFLVALGADSARAAGIKSERLLAAIIKRTPASVVVAKGEQMKLAEAAAADIPGAEAFWGVGSSMELLYSSHTAVVVAPVKFQNLEK